MKRVMAVLLTSLLTAAFLMGCGDLASVEGTDPGMVNDRSGSFAVEAGDSIDVAYWVSPAEDDSTLPFTITIAITGVGEAIGSEVATMTSSETNTVNMTAPLSGTYYLSVAGSNAHYSVSASKSD